jgi:hypothetical protein
VAVCFYNLFMLLFSSDLICVSNFFCAQINSDKSCEYREQISDYERHLCFPPSVTALSDTCFLPPMSPTYLLLSYFSALTIQLSGFRSTGSMSVCTREATDLKYNYNIFTLTGAEERVLSFCICAFWHAAGVGLVGIYLGENLCT